MKNYFVLFGLGAFAYGLLEVIWRGYSHWSMMVAGGICFVIFSLIAQKLKHLPLLYKCIIGSLTVTVTELIFGLFFNLALGLSVWDYSRIPLNLLGRFVCFFRYCGAFYRLSPFLFRE